MMGEEGRIGVEVEGPLNMASFPVGVFVEYKREGL